jgi:hypothetical protein
MDNQEFFSKTVAHLRKQNARATFDGSCVYRSADGLMCAIGCHIPDDLYSQSMEGKLVISLLDFHADVEDLFKNVDQGLMTAMQDLHDNRNIEKWEDYFSLAAEEYYLTLEPAK